MGSIYRPDVEKKRKKEVSTRKSAKRKYLDFSTNFFPGSRHKTRFHEKFGHMTEIKICRKVALDDYEGM